MTYAIPERVKPLLAPIEGDAEIGEDLDPDLDPYLDLQMALESGDPDYESCFDKAYGILSAQSKHLQIMSWLAFSMLRLDGVEGFRDGLAVIDESLKSYGADIYPSRPKRRLAALRFLNRERRIQVVIKKYGQEGKDIDPNVVAEILGRLNAIATTYKALFSGQEVDFGALLETVGALQSENGRAPDPAVAGEVSADPEPEETAPEEAPDSEKNETESKEPDGTSPPDAEEEAVPADPIPESDPAVLDAVDLPEEVAELLDAISSERPTGEDIERTEDQEAMVEYMRLQSEMQKRSGNDYPLCVSLCKAILTEKSKHIRVATWLCVAWFRTEELPGLKKGLLLLHALFDRFSDQLHPQKSTHQTKIVQRLNNEPRLQMVDKIMLGHELAEYHVSEEDIRALKEVPKQVTNKLHALKGETFIGRDHFLEKVASETSPEAAQEYEVVLLQRFQVGKAGNEQIEYTVSAAARKRLGSQGLPAAQVEALASLDGQVYKGWSRCFDALMLAVGETEAVANRAMYEAFLNRNITDVLETEHVFSRLKNTLSENFEDDLPNLESLEALIGGIAQKARDLQRAAVKRVEETESQPKEKGPAERPKPDRPKKAEQRERPREEPVHAASISPDEAVSVSKLQLQWAEDAVNVMKKALLFYFEDRSEEGEGAGQKAAAPLEARIYGMSRVFRWGNLQVLPPDQSIEGPNETRQGYLKNPPEGLDIDTQIRQIELDFLKQNEFLFWLDGQHLVVQALEKLGEKGFPAANEIKFHLAKLLVRFPELPTCLFRDKKTPFASPETLIWIEEEVVGLFGAGKSVEKILPPLLGETYDAINLQYEKACDELPDNFAENAQRMQRSIELESRQKGRFLIGLNLANFYALGKNRKIARAKFNELISDIGEYTVSDWEPALCVSTWRAAYLNNKKLLSEEQSQIERDEIERQQRALFEWIARYDGVLAHQLIEYSEEN